MGRHKGFHWTEEQKKKIGEGQRAWKDKVGRIVNIDQRESPEAYRNYQREYQRKYREKHPDYYKKYHTKPLPKDMIKLQEIQSAWNLFISKSIEYEYHTSAYSEDELKKLADDVTSKIANYLEEMRKENTNECVSGSCEK